MKVKQLENGNFAVFMSDTKYYAGTETPSEIRAKQTLHIMNIQDHHRRMRNEYSKLVKLLHPDDIDMDKIYGSVFLVDVNGERNTFSVTCTDLI
jgi:hypothetical protein